MLKFHEAGIGNEKVVVLIHGWGCPWQIWNHHIYDLQKTYHVVAPSLAGYNNDGEYGKGIEYNAKKIVDYLQTRFNSIHAVIGISFGANIVLKILAINKISIIHAIADACYLPEFKNKLQANVMGFCVRFYSFARGFRKLLIKRCAAIWGRENAIIIIDQILSMPNKTLRDEAHSYFTFFLPENTFDITTDLHLWYGEKEKEKLQNAIYVKKRFPGAIVQVFADCHHGEFMLGQSERCLRQIRTILN